MYSFPGIAVFEEVDPKRALDAAKETAAWLEEHSHRDERGRYWDVQPGHENDESLLLSSTGLYAGAAGIALFYLRLYKADGEEKWLIRAKEGLAYCISSYRGKEDFATEEQFIPGAYIGLYGGPAGGAYVASLLYKESGEEKYREYALRVADDAIAAAKEENGRLSWYGTYGIIGEGSLLLFLLDIYERFGGKKYMEAAKKAARYILDKSEEAPQGGIRWNAMPTEFFPTIKEAGGYFPGFEYGAAGCGYILARVYADDGGEEFLEAAKKAAEYVMKLGVRAKGKNAVLIPYNDRFLPGLFYLGVCQGPPGTSRLFFALYEITGDERYRDFIISLTNGMLAAGAPLVHSPGYWRTNCYCCGAAGMLEHFINVHRLSGDEKYKKAAQDAAAAIIGESTVSGERRMWYTSWNRHEPYRSDTYTGLYHGSAGCASALLSYGHYLESGEGLPPYLEDPYKTLFEKQD